MDRARSVTATFALKQYTLTVNVSGSGTVTGTDISCGLDCLGSFAHGAVVELTSAPEAGWEAAGFTGCDSSDSDSCSVTMTSNRSVEAGFEEASPCADYDPEWWPIGIWLPGSGPNGEQYVCFSTGEPEELADDRGWIASGLPADICVQEYEGTGIPENMDEAGPPRGAHGGDLICLDGETPPVEHFERCNDLDDDYDGLIDEVYPKLGGATPSGGMWRCSADQTHYVDSGA
jgi:hypothetical protein